MFFTDDLNGNKRKDKGKCQNRDNLPFLWRNYMPQIFNSAKDRTTIVKKEIREIPLATEKKFGLVTSGQGLRILQDGVMSLNVGEGLKINQDTNALSFDYSFYPEAGSNVLVTIHSTGRYTITAYGEDVFDVDSNRIPSSKAIADFFVSQIGDTEEFNADIKNEFLETSIIDAVNNFYRQSNFNFTQATESTAWIINHNMKKRPSVIAYDTEGNEIFGRITYSTVNTIYIVFSSPVAGYAILN